MLIRTDRAARACYRTDGGQIVYGFADSVVHVRAPEDVAEVLRAAQRDRIPVTCRGGGLTTGGESVTAHGILLDLKGLSRLLECDGRTAWVEAGIQSGRPAGSLPSAKLARAEALAEAVSKGARPVTCRPSERATRASAAPW